MDALTSFIIVLIAVTLQFSLYTIKRLQEPLEPDYLLYQKKYKNKKSYGHFLGKCRINKWKISDDRIFCSCC